MLVKFLGPEINSIPALGTLLLEKQATSRCSYTFNLQASTRSKASSVSDKGNLFCSCALRLAPTRKSTHLMTPPHKVPTFSPLQRVEEVKTWQIRTQRGRAAFAFPKM